MELAILRMDKLLRERLNSIYQRTVHGLEWRQPQLTECLRIAKSLTDLLQIATNILFSEI